MERGINWITADLEGRGAYLSKWEDDKAHKAAKARLRAEELAEETIFQARRQGREIRITDPITGGQKGSKPERFDLLPWPALEEVARVYAFGAQKYADHNWHKGYKWGLSLASLFRHVVSWAKGEDRDPESGLHHLAHAVFHCLTLVTFQNEKLGADDRLYSRGPEGTK
jgi:hypothetical protein